MTRSALPPFRRRPALLFLGGLLALVPSAAAQRRGGAPERNADPKLERLSIPGGPLDTPAGQLVLCADLFARNPPGVPLLVLFHSGSGSRGEYRKAGIRLNELGYNGLAVDMRVGGRSDHIRNLTAPQLFQHGLKGSVLDVLPDIVTTLEYAREHHAEGPVIAVGSASSATLLLSVAGERPELVDGLVLFSPPIGYFEQFDKPADWASQLAKKVTCPTWLTGLRSSREGLQRVFDALDTPRKVLFEPEGKGVHGAKALWPREPRHPQYWGALTSFLEERFPLPTAEAADGVPADSGEKRD